MSIVSRRRTLSSTMHITKAQMHQYSGRTSYKIVATALGLGKLGSAMLAEQPITLSECLRWLELL